MPHPVADQISAAAGDRLRVLIAGAGVAGRTLAALLRRQNLHPVVIDKAPASAEAGYMLALMPLVDPAFTAMAVTNAYRSRSTALRHYGILSHTGKPIRRYRMSDMLSRYGEYRGVSRAELLATLDDAPITHRATVTAIDQTSHAATVTITEPTAATTTEFDLVVAADGIGSATRDLLIDPRRVSGFDTGWGGWVTWGTAADQPDLAEELWGRGFFLGTYPVKDRLGIILCGHRDDTRTGAADFVQTVRDRIKTITPRTDEAIQQVVDTDDKYFWPLFDRRSATWRGDNFILLGDAAAGFLPTAGIGACMAIESAHVLAGHLSGATAHDLTGRLAEYERLQRPRVEAAQNNSRTLARLMFGRSRSLAHLRDLAARWVPIEMALRPIRGLLQTRPDTPADTFKGPAA